MIKRKNKTQGSSILNKILLPMIIIIILQLVLFLCVFSFGGISHTLDLNSYDVLNQRVMNRNREFAGTVDSWVNIDAAASGINKKLADFLKEKNLTEADFNGETAYKKEFLTRVSEDLVRVLRLNKVNGVFVILTDGEKEGGGSKYGLNLRDYDPDAEDADGKDILIERGPVTSSKEIGYSFSSWWEALYDLDKMEDTGFYTEPVRAGFENPAASYRALGYWCAPHKLSEGSTDVVSYSVPVNGPGGTPMAVFGIEVKLSYLKGLFPNSELDGNGQGSYVMAIQGEDGSYRPVIYDDSAYIRIFGTHTDKLVFEPADKNFGMFKMKSGNRQILCCIKPMGRMDEISPYKLEDVVLIGAVEESSLLRFNNNVRNSIFMIVVLTSLVGILSVYIVSRRLSRPIKLLSDRVRRIKPSNNVNLGRVNIKEIDRLIDSIEQLNRSAKENSNRISEIIRMSGMPIGTFEVRKNARSTFMSEEFRAVAESCLFSVGIIDLSFEATAANIKKLEPYADSYDLANHVIVYHFPDVGGSEKWLSIKASESADKIFGIVMDITAERYEKQKIEYERDHDMLTDLLNRRALHRDLNDLFAHPSVLGVAAMIMMDVDNLKYVNDTYGHDYGDAYLRGVAAVFKRHQAPKSLLSRISGDEFVYFIYDSSEEAILEIIENIREELKVSYIDLPDNKTYRLRISGGISWYPKDSTDSNELIKFADFSMFQIKKSIKGEFYQFNRASYDKNSYLVELGDEINRLIEDGQISYYLQPIVDLEEETVHAYEALMRPQSSAVKTPLELLTLARSQGRLYQIERLTWNESLELFKRYRGDEMKGKKLFINTISSQPLNSFDYDDIYRNYRDLLPDTVIEITEEDKIEDIKTSPLLKRIKMWNGQVAIDDYGSGYNGQSLMLDIKADYVKIDMNLIRNIECDPDRQDVVRSLIAYSRERDIQIIAEGVETREELQFLMCEGVRYIQGFLLGRPAPEPRGLSKQNLDLIRACKELCRGL